MVAHSTTCSLSLCCCRVVTRPSPSSPARHSRPCRSTTAGWLVSHFFRRCFTVSVSSLYLREIRPLSDLVKIYTTAYTIDEFWSSTLDVDYLKSAFDEPNWNWGCVVSTSEPGPKSPSTDTGFAGARRRRAARRRLDSSSARGGVRGLFDWPHCRCHFVVCRLLVCVLPCVRRTTSLRLIQARRPRLAP